VKCKIKTGCKDVRAKAIDCLCPTSEEAAGISRNAVSRFVLNEKGAIHFKEQLMSTMHVNEALRGPYVPRVRGRRADHRGPNLLVRFTGGGSERALHTLKQSSTRSVHVSILPGPLVLPAREARTWLLVNASALTSAQQTYLHEWMSDELGRVQVISVVLEPLYPLVERGRFLEDLFYRLNTISMEVETRP